MTPSNLETSSEASRPRRHTDEAITELCRADYHLACAATLLEDDGLTGWQEAADKLMCDCIDLREQIREDTRS